MISFSLLQKIQSVLVLTFTLLSCIDSDTETRSAANETDELKQIFQNAKTQGLTIHQTSLGTYYIIYKEGHGDYAAKGDTLSLIYTGYFSDGIIFDASAYHYEDSLWTITYLDPDLPLIDGMNDGLPVMKKGSVYDLIIPSGLAYGSQGNEVIPPYMPILFTVDLRDIRPTSK